MWRLGVVEAIDEFRKSSKIEIVEVHVILIILRIAVRLVAHYAELVYLQHFSIIMQEVK